MSPLEHRFAALDTFDGTGDGMAFAGLAIPYDSITTVSDPTRPRPYDEVFRMGAFAKTLSERWSNKPLPLCQSHDHSVPGVIGRAEHLEETPGGLRGQWRLSDVQAGRDAAVLMRDGVVTGLSIGFEPVKSTPTAAKDRTDGGTRPLVERTEARLYEVSLCVFPAYESAGVTAQRSEHVRTLAVLAEARAELVDRFGRIRR